MTESRRLAMPALVVGVIAVGLDAVSVAPANAAVPPDGTYATETCRS